MSGFLKRPHPNVMVEIVNFLYIAAEVVQVGVNVQPLGVLRRVERHVPVRLGERSDEQGCSQEQKQRGKRVAPAANTRLDVWDARSEDRLEDGTLHGWSSLQMSGEMRSWAHCTHNREREQYAVTVEA